MTVAGCGPRRAAGLLQRKGYLFGVYAAFFQSSPVGRAESLYSAWMNNPKLAGEPAAHLAVKMDMTERKVWNRGT